MPGIAGIIGKEASEEHRRLVTSMTRCMKHKSSYTLGTYAIPEMGIYAGWVAHENSFAAAQVLANERRDIALIFSGEFFQDRERRGELTRTQAAGKSDEPSWLVALYEELGDRFFADLNGVFSGLLVDKRRGKAFLFNDRFGFERIYWHETEDVLYFASEAKALLRILPELRDFDFEGVAQFLTFGSTVRPRTLFRNIQLMPGASVWCLDNGRCSRRKYFSPEDWESQSLLSIEDFEAKFEETFKSVLPRYFQSRSQIGISLTAGLDSRMIMACLPDTVLEPICYTFSGQNRETLDARLAARVATACGLNHQTISIAEDFLSDFASYADETIYITDGYLGAFSAHELYLNRKASVLAPIRLTGVFGGEILRGVSFLKPLGLSGDLVSPDFRPYMNSARTKVRPETSNLVTRAAFHDIPERRFATPAVSRSQLTFRTPFLDNEIVSLAYRIPKGFRTSQAPVVSLVKHNSSSLSAIPTDQQQLGRSPPLVAAFKRMISRITFKADHFQRVGLPRGLSPFNPLFRLASSTLGVPGLHKFVDYRAWMRRELSPYIANVLDDPRTRSNPLWNRSFLENVSHKRRHSFDGHTAEINAIATLETVERLLFRELPRD